MSKKNRTKPQSAKADRSEPTNAASQPADLIAPSRGSIVAGIVFAVLLAAMLGLRPVIDGYVYPYLNYYFMAFTVLLFAAWAILALLRTCPVNMPRETALLAGFVLWAAVGLTYTIQYDATFRALMLWASYACLFALCTSVLNSRVAVTILLGGFAFTAFAEAVWSLVHAQYILPFVRMQVHSDPGLLDQYFGPSASSPDLMHRLQSNRAFGTFLFPNALGAYMALAIPFAAAGSFVSWKRLRARQAEGAFQEWARDAAKRTKGGHLAGALSLAVLVAILVFSSAYLLVGLIESTDVLNRSWFRSAPIYWFSVVGVPLLCAGAVLFSMRVYGFEGFFTLFRAVAYPLATLVLVAALFAAFTRGAMIGLAAAAVFGLLLAIRPPKWFQSPGKALAALAAIGIVAGAFALALAPAPATAQEQPAPIQQPLDVAGASPTMTEALSGATFGLRLGYWQVGMRMWWNNWLGVGLGNFGTAYPSYQFIGATDVKTAHNDFLQYLSETGPIGFLLFTGFWLLFFLRGARVIPSIADPSHRIMALGVYTGLLAFVLHAIVDFNFVNPSLTMPAFALAGAFHAMTSRQGPQTASPPGQTLQLALLIPALALIAVLAGAGTRTYAADTQFRRLGHTSEINRVPIQSANYILAESVPENVEPGADFYLTVGQAMTLIPDRATLQSFGPIVAATGNPQSPWNTVSPNEPLREDMLIVIRNLDVAHAAARQASVRRAELLAAIDSAYPHRPDIASHLYQWYYLLLNTTQDPAERAAFVDACVKWARESVARSPQQGWNHSFLGSALWEKAKLLDNNERIRTLEEALTHYRRSAELYPMQTMAAHEYAGATKAFGQILIAMGRQERGQQFVAMGDAEHERAMALQERINAWRYGTPPEGTNDS